PRLAAVDEVFPVQLAEALKRFGPRSAHFQFLQDGGVRAGHHVRGLAPRPKCARKSATLVRLPISPRKHVLRAERPSQLFTTGCPGLYKNYAQISRALWKNDPARARLPKSTPPARAGSPQSRERVRFVRGSFRGAGFAPGENSRSEKVRAEQAFQSHP